jgi:hypothetical protein
MGDGREKKRKRERERGRGRGRKADRQAKHALTVRDCKLSFWRWEQKYRTASLLRARRIGDSTPCTPALFSDPCS